MKKASVLLGAITLVFSACSMPTDPGKDDTSGGDPARYVEKIQIANSLSFDVQVLPVGDDQYGGNIDVSALSGNYRTYDPAVKEPESYTITGPLGGLVTLSGEPGQYLRFLNTSTSTYEYVRVTVKSSYDSKTNSVVVREWNSADE